MLTTYSIINQSINYNNKNADNFFNMLDLLDTEMELNDALELIIQSINDGIINGCDVVDNNTGEIFFTFKNSPIPTYNATDITF